MFSAKFILYSGAIFFSFLSVSCVCDTNVSLMADDDKYQPIAYEMKKKCNQVGFGDPCGGETCCDSSLQCVEGFCGICQDEEGKAQICNQTGIDTATNISLSIAMALGIIVLIVVLWKMCVSPKNLCCYDKMSNSRRYSRQARTRMVGGVAPRSEDVTRASISSIQIRIVARLQNRPPRYESSYNYNQRIEAAKQHNATIDEAPPAYDAIEENVEKCEPPPYTIDGDTNYRGADNPTFNTEIIQTANANVISPNREIPDRENVNSTPGNSSRAVIINCETVHI